MSTEASRKHNEEWPYHEDPHGDWVACSNNPCKLHSGGDIMATSPEDAMAKADRLAHPAGGGGYDGGGETENSTMGKREAEAHRFAQAKRERVARLEEAMKGFYTPPLDDPPQDLKDQFETELRVGGRYFDVQGEDWDQIADHIRHDLSTLREADVIPEGWEMIVKKEIGNSDDLRGLGIGIRRRQGSKPVSRSIRPTDIYDPNHEGLMRKNVRNAMERETGIRGCTYNQAAKYCSRHPEFKVHTDEAEEVRDCVQKIADQYSLYGESYERNRSAFDNRSFAYIVDDDRRNE